MYVTFFITSIIDELALDLWVFFYGSSIFYTQVNIDLLWENATVYLLSCPWILGVCPAIFFLLWNKAHYRLITDFSHESRTQSSLIQMHIIELATSRDIPTYAIHSL